MNSPQNSNPNYHHRLDRFRSWLKSHEYGGALISRKENILYLTGLDQIHPTNREALFFVALDKALLYHSAFTAPLQSDCYETLAMSSTQPLHRHLTRLFETTKNLAFESDNLTVSEFDRFKSMLPESQFFPEPNPLQEFREIKDHFEIDRMSEAARITQATMKWVIRYLRKTRTKNITEVAMARKINMHLEMLGADGPAFPTIVAVGENSASPHHQPTEKNIGNDQVVLLDFGAKYQGYCADMTRTMYLGVKPPALFQEVKSIVRSAYNHTVKSLNTPHPKALDLDLAARTTINEAGFGAQFIHTTGHSLGLEIHEQPSLNGTNRTPLKPGMVITIEPGIYLKGDFGYRHENTIQVKKSGYIELTT